MPPRLSKRQQREKEDIEALGGPSVASLEFSSEDGDPGPTSKPAKTGFAALAAATDEIEEDEEKPVSKSKKSKKKKKPATTITSSNPARASPAPTQTPAPAQPRNEKKAAKKEKQKAKKAERDELEQALAELSVKYPELQQTASSSSATTSSLASLLSVSLTHLDADAEMRKFFGAKVVSANKPSGSTSGPGRRHQSAVLRSNLTRPQPSWAHAKHREGLSIRALEPDEHETVGQEKWWTVVYSKKYKSMTKAFMQTVLSGDPQGFWDLLRRSPWHADTLLQLSEVYAHREEHAPATDAIDRALFTYERAFIGAFNFTSGLNRLDFNRVENRPFFLAIHRQAIDLQRRGCMRTAFEFARLLYGLDPWTDPHGALLHLDFVALKAGMREWLLEVYELFDRRQEKDRMAGKMDPSVLPGWTYTRALAMRLSKDEKASQALVDAVAAFPSVVPLLADKLEVSLPSEIRGHKEFRIYTDAGSLSEPEAILHLQSHLYVQRSLPIWKDSQVALWFRTTVSENFPASLPASGTPHPRRARFLVMYKSTAQLRYTTYRHVLVQESNFRRLFAFIPRAILAEKSLSCDPLPPPGAISRYDDPEFFAGVESFGALGRGAGVLEQLIPNARDRAQVLRMFEGNPMLVEMFGGDVVRFLEALPNLPVEMFLQDAEGMELRDGGMPGGFGDDEDGMDLEDNWDGGGQQEADVAHQRRRVEDTERNANGSDDEEDEDEDEEEIAPLPVRLIRNVLGRFWGGNQPSQDSSSSEDEDAGEVRRDGRPPVRDDDID